MFRLSVVTALTIVALVSLSGVTQAGDAGLVSLDASPVRGVVRPSNEAAISSQLALAVIAAPRKVGESFKKGDILVELDCRQLEAERTGAAASEREMEISLQSNTYLQKMQAGAKLEVEISKARTERAAAEVAAIEAKLSQCKIFAPFDGRVVEVGIHAYEMVAPGRPLLSIIDESTLEVMLILPSAWLKWAQVGSKFDFVVDETGMRVSSEIVRIGAVVDPVSKTVQVFGSLPPSGGLLLSGMSGSAVFSQTNM